MARDPHQLRMENIRLASAGLALALLVMLVLSLTGFARVTPFEWGTALLLTTLLQALVWIAAQRSWAERLSWDPHFVVLPTIGVIALLSVYLHIAPEARVLVLVAWPIVLHFLAGLVGFLDVAALSVMMTFGYLVAVRAIAPELEPGEAVFEVVIAGVFLAINLYAGLIHERLRRQRREFRSLRRQLATSATTDALTLLPNRRYLEEAIVPQLSVLARQSQTFSIGMLDIDYFKHYNDTHGHPAGDALLREFAGVLRERLRASDVLVRYGGEEFALIMPDAGKTEAEHVMDRLRRLVAEHPFSLAHVQPGGGLTLSAGIATCPEDGTDVAALIARADAALYAAKRQGKNRVVAAAR